ncbi:MAG: Uma2 family endonuclease [Acidobacteria bacterium]|nr:Uma2 family endonuclease [Acidobacteriota bacterium]
MPQETETQFDLDEVVNSLVTEDDEPVDNILSEKQQRLLTEILYSSWTPPSAEEDEGESPRPFWASANVGVFPSVHQAPLVPDVFISLDVSPPENIHDKKGRSYLVWEVGKMPEVVVEIVSNSEGGELDRKKRDYARMGVRYYVVFDPMRLLSDDALRVYEPGFANRYRMRNDYLLPDVGLGLVFKQGVFEKVEYNWLRWCDVTGALLPTPDERAAQANERAAQADERAAQAEADKARLAARLRELGVDPDQV